MTYAELNLRANQIAHRLRSFGVGPDVVVAVLMERSLDLLTCLLGIMKAGGAYLPLDTGLPTRRVSFMLEHSCAALLLTKRVFAKAIPDRHVRVLDLDAERVADLVLAVDEIAANSIRHGEGAGTLRMWCEGGGVICEVRDRGRIVDPLAGRARVDQLAEGGRGLWLANQLCDLVQIRTFAAGTVVRLHMRLS